MDYINRPNIKDNFYLHVNYLWLTNEENKLLGKNSTNIIIY